MLAIEDSPGPKAAYRGGGIILLPAILLLGTRAAGSAGPVDSWTHDQLARQAGWRVSDDDSLAKHAKKTWRH